MNLLPVPARVPARKHLLAGAVALLSVGLMLVAVLGTGGLPTPFSSGTSAGVRTSPVDVAGSDPTTTTTSVTPQQAAGVFISDEPTTPTTRPSTGSTATTQPPSAPTTTTTLIPATTVPPNPTDDLLGGLDLGRGLLQP